MADLVFRWQEHRRTGVIPLRFKAGGRIEGGLGLKASAWFLWIVTVLCLMGCGDGAPTESQVAMALKRDIKQLEKVSLGLTKAALKDIRIIEKRKVPGEPGAYEIQVTARVLTRIGNFNGTRPCSATIKLKQINNQWALAD